MNNKKFLIALLSVLILVFNSCNNDSTNPTNPKVSFKVSDLVGTWKSSDQSLSFTINGNGYLDLTTSQTTSSVYIMGFNLEQEVLEGKTYEIYLQVNLTQAAGGGKATLTLIFDSASTCIASLLGNKDTCTKQ